MVARALYRIEERLDAEFEARRRPFALRVAQRAIQSAPPPWAAAWLVAIATLVHVVMARWS